MPVVTLDYRHCHRLRPAYIKHSEVEVLAALIRQQLVDAKADAMPLKVFSDISGLKINGVVFDLFVGTGNVLHDEEGKPVLGVCEYDPGVPDTAMLSVSPIGENASEELVLSTFGHELGHAVFDAPGWIIDASKGRGLFDDPVEMVRKVYRTTTPDGDHLSITRPANDVRESSGAPGNLIANEAYFAELRANEFMGSLLVPRRRLNLAVEELAGEHGVAIHRSLSLDPELPDTTLRLSTDGVLGFFNMDCLQKALAKRFGVNPRFIQVRMDRYGLLKSEAKIN